MAFTTLSDIVNFLKEAEGPIAELALYREDELGQIFTPAKLPLKFYDGQISYDFPVRLSNSFPVSWGTPGSDGAPSSVKASFTPKSLFAYLEIEAKAAKQAQTDAQVVPEFGSAIKDKLTNAINALQHAVDLALWGDGSGRLSQVAGVDTVNLKKIYLKPVFSKRDNVDYVPDATRWLRPGMYIDFATYDETNMSGSVVPDGVGFRIIEVHEGTAVYANGTEDSPYIIVDQNVPGGVVAGTYVVLHKSLNETPIGLLGVIGGGTTNDYANHATMPHFGRREYGTIDSITHTAWSSFIYNRILPDPTALVTLTPQVMDDWMQRIKSYNQGNVDIYYIIGNPKTLAAYNAAFDQFRYAQTFFGEGKAPTPELGYTWPVYTSPWFLGHTIKFIASDNCPLGWLFAIDPVPWGVGDVPGSGWAPGNIDGIWNDMLNNSAVKSDVWVAAYRRYMFYVAHNRRRAVSAICNIDVTPTFPS